MRKAICAVATLMELCHPATAADLGGRWNVFSPAFPAYEGTVLIDALHRVLWDAGEDNGHAAKYVGYVRADNAIGVVIVMTDRAEVLRVNCVTESTDLMRCQTTHTDGTMSALYALTRVGPTPAPLASHR